MSTERGRDSGLTLIEVLVVVLLLGLVSVVLAAVIGVIVRGTPGVQERVDDARALQGRVTWLPGDVDSTLPHGFDIGVKASGCSTSTPGHNLLHLTWTETIGATTTTFVANYRHVTDADGPRIVRYICSGIGSLGAATANNASAELMALPATWTQGQLPARVTLTPASGDVSTVTFEVETATGKQLRVDAAPKNPDETLPTTSVATGTTTTTTTVPPTTTTVVGSTTTTIAGSTTTTTVPCTVSSLTTDDANDTVNLKNAAPSLLESSVIVTVTWSGGCQGLYLDYDSGGAGALLSQNFGPTSPGSVTLVGHPFGVELWTLGDHTLAVRDGNGGPYGTSINLVTVAKGASS
jgi:hypothetical protein